MKKIIIALLIAVLACFSISLAEEALPPYSYPGNDPVEAAVTKYMIDSGMGEKFGTASQYVSIPAPVILKTERIDDTHCRVYGNFWMFNYILTGQVLQTISGGEAPGIMTLEKSEDAWAVTDVTIAGEGEDYYNDIEAFCAGDKALEERYIEASNAIEPPTEPVIRRFNREYVQANGLEIYFYQDPGWAPVPLAEDADNTLAGVIVDGSYYIRIPVRNDAGEWIAEEPAGEDAVVTLGGTELENGVFAARYDPHRDGRVTVYLRHMSGYVCDEAHGFDLLVEGGKVTECTGGSYEAAPEDESLDNWLCGSWLESDTQFTQMTIGKNPEAGWDVEIISPVSHGSFAFCATIRYDIEQEQFVYINGDYYDLPLTDADAYRQGTPTATGTMGTISFVLGSDERDVRLQWNSFRDDIPAVLFSRAPADYTVATSAAPELVEDFADRVWLAVMGEDWDTLADMISYPVRMSGETGPDSKEAFLALVKEKGVRQEFINGIEGESCHHLFANSQGICMGSGEIWFGNMHEASGDPAVQPELKIFSINGMLKE